MMQIGKVLVLSVVLGCSVAWAGEPVAGKDCPDLMKFAKMLSAMENTRLRVGTVNVERLSQDKMRVPEAQAILSAFNGRAAQPTNHIIAYTEGSKQIGCKKLIMAAGTSHGVATPASEATIVKYTAESATIELGGLWSLRI